MAEIVQFRFPTDIRFGVGARAVLSEFAQKYQVGRPLLVTDTNLVQTQAYRLIEQQMQRVWADSYARFSGISPNPTDQDVERAWQCYSTEACDGIVGLGGGSALDAARAVRLKVTAPKRSLIEISLVDLPKLTPFCAIPTTAGTGSEVGRSSVIIIASLGRKEVFGAQPMMADMAVLDPDLTIGLPPNLTAYTGMDAMTHAVESYVCPIFHPICDAIALEAIRLCWIYLPQAYADGKNLDARGMMQVAAAMGAIAFQKDLGAAHSLSHPLSSELGIQHGLANAVCLPAVMRFNRDVVTDRYARIARCLGIGTPDLSETELANRAIDATVDLNRRVGIPTNLAELGVKKEQLPPLARKAFADPCHRTNPRPCSQADLLELYEQAYGQ